MYRWLFIFFVLVLAGCTKSANEDKGVLIEKVFFEMGTVVNLSIENKYAKYIPDIMDYMKELTQEIKSDENKISTAQIGRAVKVNSHTIHLFKEVQNYYKISNGVYDPTAYTVAELYGFAEGKDFKVPEKSVLEKAKSVAGFEKLSLNGKNITKSSDLKVEFSANSKGYIVDKVSEYMKKKGMKNFIVNAGGDLYCSGRKSTGPFKVYIEKPDSTTSKILSIIKLENKAVATSGNYERYFFDENGNRITHIFSGISFEPKNNYQSVSVIADTTEKADGLATLFYLLEIDEIKTICKQTNTPVLVYTLDSAQVKLCNWEEYEEK